MEVFVLIQSKVTVGKVSEVGVLVACVQGAPAALYDQHTPSCSPQAPRHTLTLNPTTHSSLTLASRHTQPVPPPLHVASNESLKSQDGRGRRHGPQSPYPAPHTAEKHLACGGDPPKHPSLLLHSPIPHPMPPASPHAPQCPSACHSPPSHPHPSPHTPGEH
ncbi:hypothetical protein E2C01_010291 [Portunus trituberculatus]|uniref:Uncharacterized protein n=1 Tax=Portunus trituberculatus TaxID=210409 RepID=A0A5B7D879_PORTR|nr:hypothetical protein [Portunus trituberculatus]